MKQARAASDAGLDGFVIDTWWRPDGTTLYEEAWTKGILPALERPDFVPGSLTRDEDEDWDRGGWERE